MRRFLRIVLLLSTAIGGGLFVWAVVIEPDMMTYKSYSLHLKGWPEALAGLEVAVVADPHVGSPHITLEKLDEIVAATNARKPDLILLAGDYIINGVIGGTPIPSRDIAQGLSKLRAKYGVFAVLGNHDWHDPEHDIIAEMEAFGIPLLEDRAMPVSIGDETIWIVGVTDYYEGPHNVAKAMVDIPAGATKILLSHTPDLFPELPEDILLSVFGHTHGGQVYIPFIGRPVVPSEYGERYVKGHVREGKKHAFISSGIGTSIIPVRFMTPPEVSFLHLYPAR